MASDFIFDTIYRNITINRTSNPGALYLLVVVS